MGFKNINDNPVSKRWKKRYSEQPKEVQKELDKLKDTPTQEYQLEKISNQKIKEVRTGDIFLLSPRKGIYFYGRVINDKIANEGR